MNKLLSTCLLLLMAGACEPATHQMHDKGDNYENFEKFEIHVAKQAAVLGKKYAIKELGFDVECIYGASDLSKLVTEMLDLGGFRYKLLSEKLDADKKQHVSLFEVAGKPYEFRTSSEGDYVDLDTVLLGLELIAKRNAPGYEYLISNHNGVKLLFYCLPVMRRWLLWRKATLAHCPVVTGGGKISGNGVFPQILSCTKSPI